MCDISPIENNLKQEEVLLQSLFNFTVDNAIRRVKTNEDSLKLNSEYLLLVYADYVRILGGSVPTIKKK